MGEIWAKMVLEVPCFEKIRPVKYSSFFFNFWRSFSLQFVLGKFGEIWAEILRTLKNLPAPTPMCNGNHCLTPLPTP